MSQASMHFSKWASNCVGLASNTPVEMNSKTVRGIHLVDNHSGVGMTVSIIHERIWIMED